MIKVGSMVGWDWGQGYAKGRVKETYTESITKVIKGAEVTRHGEHGNKALLIEQKDGTEVLKKESEVEHI